MDYALKFGMPLTRAVSRFWSAVQRHRSRPKRKVSLGFRVRSDTDIDLRTRDYALLSAMSDTGMARLESGHLAEVVSFERVAVSARTEGGSSHMFGEAVYIGAARPDNSLFARERYQRSRLDATGLSRGQRGNGMDKCSM